MALFSSRKFTMKLLSGFCVGHRGFFLSCARCIEILPISAATRDPFFAIFSPMHAANAGFIIGAPLFIHGILSACRLAQIVPSIIRFIKIAMVDFFHWPIACHIKPHQSMSSIFASINPNSDISFFVGAASNRANNDLRARYLPDKNTHLGIIIENGSKIFGGEFCTEILTPGFAIGPCHRDAL